MYARLTPSGGAANRVNHYGVQLASTISDFDTQVATTAALKAIGGRWPSGSVLQTEGQSTTLLHTADRCFYTPLWVPEARTTADIEVELTTVGAGGTPTLRLGLYLPDANGRPGALLVDAGTVDATATPGVLVKAVSQALSVGLIWVAIAAQGATVTQPTIRAVTGYNRFVNLTTFNGSSARTVYSQVGIAGALPNPAVPVLTGSNLGGWAGLKAA